MKTICLPPDQWGGLADAACAPDLPAFDLSLLARHRPEVHVVACDDAGRIAARCSCWVREAPPYPPETPGVIGHFDAAGISAGHDVLAAAVDWLRAAGCTAAIGPMDGNTWRRYRLATWSCGEPPFLMEPANPELYPFCWTTARFLPLAEYQSTLVTALDRVDPRLDRARDRLASAGIVLRTLDPARFEEDLRLIHRVSLAAFARNFLYTPMAVDEFMAQYLPFRDRIRPEFVLFALRGDEPVGFTFCLPDYLRPAAGHPLDTLILKTEAILPGRAQAGLGTLMTQMTHQAAVRAGLTRVIHALSHSENPVVNISARYGTVLRRYTLYARRLVS